MPSRSIFAHVFDRDLLHLIRHPARSLTHWPRSFDKLNFMLNLVRIAQLARYVRYQTHHLLKYKLSLAWLHRDTRTFGCNSIITHPRITRLRKIMPRPVVRPPLVSAHADVHFPNDVRSLRRAPFPLVESLHIQALLYQLHDRPAALPANIRSTTHLGCWQTRSPSVMA
ncbi:unnamed protein product [Trichogramma brassicae]|uniref:Uncharacterized protein n=1 Tax=Trichogramma brassicae TaxID=86971 RepID=A0A6H5I9L9_9HYME|nr:unnamed protein product [Trichogramma brassicae]